ncbi:AGAP010001-PA-like protein [Anopheles sinensis]|uniref:AGAP010001-PA-like protein n=1 Tax=Anopheles sinensis TaxID=74873 RepID=A0A084VSP8_ANOSI|nr:AGAP010001-PA-like protein [Anopheles sinensis]
MAHVRPDAGWMRVPNSIHKEWLERRAAQKTHSSTAVLPQPSDGTTQRTTYLRKLIKFTNENEPLSENDVSFVPHFEGDAGGGGGAEGVNKGVIVANGASRQQEGPHHRRDQQGRELHHHRLHHGEHATPQPELRGKDLLTEDGDRYRYEVVTVQEAGVSETAKPLAVAERKETDSKPVVYVMGSPEGDEAERGTPSPEFNERPRPTVATNVVPYWLPHQNRNAGTSDNTSPGPNDLSSISEPTASRKSDPTTPDAPTEATGNAAVHVRSSTKPSGEGTGPDPTTTNSVEEPRMTALALPSSPSTALQLADGNVTVRNVFGSWSNWTACSRTCGGGVKTQHRSCWKRDTKPAVESHECIGIVKRFHLCNEQDCPITDGDFREQQCARFNNQTFQDKRYIWEAFVKEDAECELNCKPIGMRYFATLNKTVIDGTPCIKPTEYFRNNESTVGRGICVEGVCKVGERSCLHYFQPKHC